MSFKFVIAALLVLSTSPLYAYLDPATGSAIFQGILAALAGLALVVKTYWFKISGWFRKDKAEEQPTKNNPV